MKPPPSRRFAAPAAVAIVGILVLVRSDIRHALGVVLLLPLMGSFVLVVAVASLFVSAARADRTLPGPSFAARQRAATRRFDFAAPGRWEGVLARAAAEEPMGSVHSHTHFSPVYGLEAPVVAGRLDTILRLIRASFIMPWYSKISPSPTFPDVIEGIIRHAVGEASRRAEAVDWPGLVVSRVLPIVTEHFVHFRTVEHLAPPPSQPSGLPLPLPPNAHEAVAAHPHAPPEANIPDIEQHLRETIERILPELLPTGEQSDVVLTMAREIVLGAVLMPVFNMLCDSDFWNRLIKEQGGKYLHQRKQVNKILSALSTLPAATTASTAPSVSGQPGSSPAQRRLAKMGTPFISIHSTSKQFDEFMRSIPKLRTLGEARRLRADVDRELRAAHAAERAAVANADKDRTRRAERYVHRLERARMLIDSRIASLSGNTSPDRPTLSSDSPLASKVKINLYEILSDPSSLAYWLEYMDRRGRSHLVQFWLTVEGFKDPLEASGQYLALENALDDDESRPGASDSTIGDDLAFLHQTYFSSLEHQMPVPQPTVAVIAELAELVSHTTPLGAADVQRAKRAVYEAQKAVYEEMDNADWADFQKSELYLKALADLKVAAPRPRGPVRSFSQSATDWAGAREPLKPPVLESHRRASDLGSPVSRRPYLVHTRGSGTFAPAPAAPTAQLAPPDFSPTLRKPTPPPGARPGSVSPRIPSPRAVSPQMAAQPLDTPPPRASRSTHLDFLLGADGDEDRGHLFDQAEEDSEAVLEAQLEAQRMEAIQAALNDILAADDMTSSQQLGTAHNSGATSPNPAHLGPPLPDVDLDRHPLAGNKLTSRSAEDLKARASRSESLVNRATVFDASVPRKPRLVRRGSADGTLHRSTKSIFADDVNIEEEPAAEEGDEHAAPEPTDVVLLAAPGDMELSAEIKRLGAHLAEQAKQDELLGGLIRQAELTGNRKDLKLLLRSQSSLQREIRTAQFQKAQYERQEEEHRLVPGRTRVVIPSSGVTTDDSDGVRQVVRYTVEVHQVDAEGRILLSWAVTHRYNEFWELDRAIREWAVAKGSRRVVEDVRSKMAEIPGKRLVPGLSSNVVETRRAGLEKYLQSLLTSDALCDSPLVRAFLSPSGSSDLSASTGSLSALAPHNLVKNLYRTVASYDPLGPSLLDVLSQSLSRQLSEVAPDLTGLMPALKAAPWGWPYVDGSTPVGPAGGPIAPHLPPAIQPLDGESAAGFTAPICDLFIEVFSLETSWLRRQAIVILLQQILGGTIERKLRDTVRAFTSPQRVAKLLYRFQDTMWPGGTRRAPTPPRTREEIDETRITASRRLGALMPDLAANVVGRGNARRAAQRVFGALQDTRLNQHLVLCVLDEVFAALFPKDGRDKERDVREKRLSRG